MAVSLYDQLPPVRTMARRKSVTLTSTMRIRHWLAYGWRQSYASGYECKFSSVGWAELLWILHAESVRLRLAFTSTRGSSHLQTERWRSTEVPTSRELYGCS